MPKNQSCPYCQNGRVLVVTKNLKSPSDGLVYIYENRLRYANSTYQEAITINYCPMCGRKLEEPK